MEAGRILTEHFPFLAGPVRTGRPRSRTVDPEFPPREFDESVLRDATLHEAGEVERALREQRKNAADEQLDAAVAARLEQPTQWYALDRETGEKYFVEIEGGRPSVIQFREPYQIGIEGEVQSRLKRFVRKVDVSRNPAVPTWFRSDLSLNFNASGEVLGHRDLPPESISPDEKRELAEMLERSVIEGAISR